TERRPVLARAREIDDHVDALLFDAERRNLEEAERLDETNGAVQRLALPPPVLDDHASAGADAYGVRRQKLGDDLEIPRIAERQDLGARQDHGRALLRDAQDAAGHRRLHLDHRAFAALQP